MLEVKKQNGLQTKTEGLNSLLEKFIYSLDVAEKSKDTYRKALKQFFIYVSENKFKNITRDTVLVYKEALRVKKLSAYTISSYIVSVRKFFEYAESLKLYPNIAKGIKGIKQPKGFRKDALTVDQVKKVLNKIDRSTLEGKRDFALINLLIRTGLRTIEIIRADIEDIRQEGGEALLSIQGKGRDTKDEIVLLTGETLTPIREYLSGRGSLENTAPLFASLSDRNKDKRLTTRSISRIVKTHLRDTGLNDKRLTAHSLRHTAVTLSLLGGATIQEAQTLARHANINTTLIYSHNIERVGKAPERKIDLVLA